MPRILIVEESKINQNILKHFFEAKGFECDVVASGANALTLVHQKEYVLIFMNLRIPNLDGFAAARAIRQTGCTLPIIAMAEDTISSDQLYCMESGINGYITRPFSNYEFEHVIRMWHKKKERNVESGLK